ncbi:hypothetical protein SKAU_G00337130 [Synaphobranchus kaupii]|uniref:Coiled-coil domain-containing protein 9B n=1 Tax=Synaphobranchus kaupii TaxID=118154 RepID=A0A9Q1EMF6_SYNKA|nr:hypothetical protein SKAU_G00337130 [Synaphobranchus kaupii]
MAYYIPGTWKLDMEDMYWHDRGSINDAFIICKYDDTLHKKGGMDEIADPPEDVSMQSEVDESPTDVMFRKKDQKDAELDKKIEALRKKNEALMKRYQEVEEDKKRAEEEGMGLQSRKGKAEDLTITINKSSIQETRVVTKKLGSGDAPSTRGVQEPAEGDINPFGMGRGKRRQLLVTMAGNTKDKRIVSEKRGLSHPPSSGGVREIDEDEDVECARRGRHLQPSVSDSRPQEDEGRQEVQGLTEESQWLAECDPYYKDVEGSVPQSLTDLTVPTSREEQLEYLRWKKEREQIDRERVARHKNAKGQWRRAWDMDKSENMFRDRFHGESERGNKTRGGRNARRGQPRATGESQDYASEPYRNREEGGKNVPAVSSKAKGKDRLTGRARRWDAKEEDDHLQTMETSLEEFLEELDALVGPEVDLSPKSSAESREEDVGKDFPLHAGAVGADEAGSDEAVDGDGPEGGGVPSPESDRSQGDKDAAVDAASGTPAASQGEMALKPCRAPDKKVSFSEETVKETKGTEEMAPSPAPPEPEVTGAIKGSSHGRESLLAVAEEAEQTLASGLRGPEGDGVQKRDREVSDLPRSSAPVRSVLVDCHADGQGPEGTSKSEMVEKKHEDAQGLTPEPETDQRTADGTSAALPRESAHQPLKHSKNTRSPEEMINSSLSLMSLDSGAPHPYHETSNAKVKENGKIV